MNTKQTRSLTSLTDKRIARLGAAVLAGVIVLGAAGWFWKESNVGGEAERKGTGPAPGKADIAQAGQPAGKSAVIQLSADQQRTIGLKTAPVTSGTFHDMLIAPGRIAPNELQYAYITPRAAGVVRSVTAHVGQDVKAGDLLATIDSPEVGRARLELYTMLQTLEIAQAQADWEETIYRNTLELLERLQRGESSAEIHTAFQDRALGANRERMMTAYAQYRLAVTTFDRHRELYAQKLITTKQFEKVSAEFEVAQATYQSLMDQMGYEARLANTRAHQALRQAETSVRAARERLRILGVKPDGTEPDVAGNKVVGVKPDGTLPPTSKESVTAEKPEAILPETGDKNGAVKPVGAEPDKATKPNEAPVSTYSIWAPFDGTILEREMIVPGVAVDTTHRIFTLANLATVWVEASVHESDFGFLHRSRGGQIRLRSDAYPERDFEGEVIYTGDLVDEKSRTVKLLARCKNSERLLKPGMFVEVQVLSRSGQAAAQVPSGALLTQGNRTFLYVRTGPDMFTRREVQIEPPRGDTTVVRSGLEPGEEVVVEGGFKLKSLDLHLTTAQR
jgi:membrane fusion protein, heavy metal efflux system